MVLVYLEVEFQDMLTASKELWREGDQPAVVPMQDVPTADLATYQKQKFPHRVEGKTF
jgi:hypothetical protein